MASGISKLLEDKNLARKFGENGKKLIRESYNHKLNLKSMYLKLSRKGAGE